MTTTGQLATTTDRLELDIGGMTCAACANRVERKLNAIPGVSAAVNLAVDRAIVTGIDAPEAIAAVEKAGYSATVHDPQDDAWTRRASQARLSSLRRRLGLAAVLTIPLGDLTIVLALVPQWRFPGWQLLCVLLALPIVTWCAWPFHAATLRGLRHGVLSMDTLVSLGTTVSFGWALYTLINPSSEPGYWLGFGRTPPGADAIYLDVAAGLVTFQLAGRYFEARARRKVGDVTQALADLAVRTARLIDQDGVEREIPADQLRVGDRYVARPGDRLVADGVVQAGDSAVDTSPMTGESIPVEVAAGSPVIGGTTNLHGRLVVQATAVGERTRLAQMAAIAQDAQRRKSRVQHTADQVTAVFVPTVIALAAVVGLAWWLSTGSLDRSLANAVAVLIIACPCALGLATPTALMVGISRGSQLGILIKGHDALEASGRIDTVVFDKTGTLTTGEMRVRRVVTFVDEVTAEQVAHIAAALERGSSHPVAAAITDYVSGQVRGATVEVDGLVVLPGGGVRGELAGRRTTVGSTRAIADEIAEIPSVAREFVAAAEDQAATPCLVVQDGRVIGGIDVADQVRASAAPAVAALHDLGLRTVLLTGDSPDAARAVADQVGITEVLSRVLPDEKAARIEKLRASGRVVAMVGDGINDAAALASADLGMAMVQGTDIAMKSADVIVVRRDLRAVVDAVQLSRRTFRTIRTNLAWAFGYNIAAIPIAAGGLLNPLIAAAAMAASSMLVVSNSLRLRSFERTR